MVSVLVKTTGDISSQTSQISLGFGFEIMRKVEVKVALSLLEFYYLSAFGY